MSDDGFPWDDSPEFREAMLTYERNHPAGPNHTLYRRYLMWSLYQQPLWNVPDDPFEPEDWLR